MYKTHNWCVNFYLHYIDYGNGKFLLEMTKKYESWRVLVFLDGTESAVMIAPSSENVGSTSFFSRLAKSMCFSHEQRHYADNRWEIEGDITTWKLEPNYAKLWVVSGAISERFSTLNIRLPTSDVYSDGALIYSFLESGAKFYLMTLIFTELRKLWSSRITFLEIVTLSFW